MDELAIPQREIGYKTYFYSKVTMTKRFRAAGTQGVNQGSKREGNWQQATILTRELHDTRELNEEIRFVHFCEMLSQNVCNTCSCISDSTCIHNYYFLYLNNIEYLLSATAVYSCVF